jgi:hypothetical protein
VLRKGDGVELGAALRLAALGDTALDVLELDVVGVVGLDIGCEAVEGALDSFLGGRVHHARLHVYILALIPHPLPSSSPGTGNNVRIGSHHLASS